MGNHGRVKIGGALWMDNQGNIVRQTKPVDGILAPINLRKGDILRINFETQEIEMVKRKKKIIYKKEEMGE
jgi:hypothetical protein